MRKLRIGVDLDGVVYDFVDAVRQYLVKVAGRKAEDLPDAEIWDFPVHQWGLTWDEFSHYCHTGVDDEFIFRVGEPHEGAVAALKTLKLQGHSLHVVTDRSFGSKSHQNTSDWLKEWEIPFDSLTFSPDKTIVKVDVAIDDRDKNFHQLTAAGIPTILFDQAWNSHVEANEWQRVRGWAGVMKTISMVSLDDYLDVVLSRPAKTREEFESS